MAITVEASGGTLKITQTGRDPIYVNADDVDVEAFGSNVLLHQTSIEKKLLDDPFGDFTDPSGGDAETVADAISILIGTAMASGTQDVSSIDPATAGDELPSIAANASSVELLPASTTRSEATIRNDGTGTLFITEGAAATANSANKLLQDDEYEVTGSLVVNGIWTAPNGFARINEKTK